MSIYFSNYVRQGKKTFKIKKLEAGKFSAHVSYIQRCKKGIKI